MFLGTDLFEVDEAMLHPLLVDMVAEGKQVDCKVKIDFGPDSAKKDLIADVTSFAKTNFRDGVWISRR